MSQITSVYCVGSTTDSLFTLISNHHVTQTHLYNIHCGNGYTIYSNNTNSSIFVQGKNNDGECGLGRTKSIKHLRALKYFTNKNLGIKRICTNINRNSTFFITHDYKVYGTGRNNAGQLGIDDTNTQRQPIEIDYLRNKYITDMTLVGDYTLALHDCRAEALLIMHYWARTDTSKSRKNANGKHTADSIRFPRDIVNLIYMFGPILNKVYSTQYRHSLHKLGTSRWGEIDNFKDDSIVRIRAGRFHSIFMQNNGTLWCLGGNQFGQLGVIMEGRTQKYVEDPIKLDMFILNEICILEIACGAFHTLVVDYNGNVYAFGRNDKGQCGECIDDDKKHVYTPQIVQGLDDVKVTDIDCGSYHSYCGSDEGMHYLFGSNDHNECCTFDERVIVRKPWLINEIVEEKCNGVEDVEIVTVKLDYGNTRIIVSATK